MPPIIDGTKYEMQHAIKVTAPIIPMILSYEGQIRLTNGVNVKTALKKIIDKILQRDK
jgi:hypothetical protein